MSFQGRKLLHELHSWKAPLMSPWEHAESAALRWACGRWTALPERLPHRLPVSATGRRAGRPMAVPGLRRGAPC